MDNQIIISNSNHSTIIHLMKKICKNFKNLGCNNQKIWWIKILIWRIRRHKYIRNKKNLKFLAGMNKKDNQQIIT